MLARGHRVIFVVDAAFTGKLSPFGFEEHVYSHRLDDAGKKQNPGEKLANYLVMHKVIGPYSAKEKAMNMLEFTRLKKFENYANHNRCIEEAIDKFKPDVIFVDGGGCLLPAIAHSGIPWIKNISPQPLYFAVDDELPPGGFGELLDYLNFENIHFYVSIKDKVQDSRCQYVV